MLFVTLDFFLCGLLFYTMGRICHSATREPQMSESLYMVYPERRFVSVDKVIAMAQDAWDTEPEGDRPTTAQDAIHILEDRGLVTFARAERRQP